MEKQQEKLNIDSVDGKITTFAPPAVLAAILDKESLNEDAIHDTMVDTNEREPDSERVQDSLEFSLNDSLQEFGVLERVYTNNPLESTEQVFDFPKTSTPAQKTNGTNDRTVEKAPRPRHPQHIIERNKENVGKRLPGKSSYARMHATKAKSKLDNKRDERSRNREDREKSPGFASGSDSGLGKQSEHFEDNSDLEQSANSFIYENGSQLENDVGYPVHDRQEGDLLPDSFLNGACNTYHNHDHGPYYDVSQTANVYHNTYEPGFPYQPTSYTRGYQSGSANLRQSHAMAGPIPPLHYNPLSTQSAPPGGYGFHHKPLMSNKHHLHEEYYYDDLSVALPNSNSERVNKIPEPSLHRKFSSEPYLVQSSSPSLQKMANVGGDSKASGSYSSLRQPFQYKPYTLKDYRIFAGANVEHLAGGLGPNVDSDEFKEKMKKVSKQREYAAMLRSQHSTMRKQEERKGSTQLPVKPKHVKEAEMKRQAALNYAKNVPKPKQMAGRNKGSPGSRRYRDSQADNNQEEITVLEILRLRHEKEKKEVDTIRKDLASKIRL